MEHQSSLASKEEQLQGMIELHKDNPKIGEFIAERLALNAQLLQQKEILCQKISQWNSHFEMNDNITNQVIELRLEYDSICKKVSNFLNWQRSDEGKREDMPRIDESHKEILFAKWDS